jgi:hypothetical protein
MGEVRGASILGTFDFIREQFGADAPATVFQAVAPDAQAVLGDERASRILVTGWYDYRVLTVVTREMDRRFGKNDLTLARACGKYVAFQDVNRFFKWILRLAGPGTLFTRSASVWNNYHNTGKYIPEEIESNRACIRVEDWGSADPIMCKRVEGWMERALELTLGSSARPHIEEVAHRTRDAKVTPHTFCRFRALWD